MESLARQSTQKQKNDHDTPPQNPNKRKLIKKCRTKRETNIVIHTVIFCHTNSDGTTAIKTHSKIVPQQKDCLKLQQNILKDAAQEHLYNTLRKNYMQFNSLQTRINYPMLYPANSMATALSDPFSFYRAF